MATPNTLTIAYVAAMSHERTNTNSAFYPFRGYDASRPHARIAECRDVRTNLVGKDGGLGELMSERLRSG